MNARNWENDCDKLRDEKLKDDTVVAAKCIGGTGRYTATGKTGAMWLEWLEIDNECEPFFNRQKDNKGEMWESKGCDYNYITNKWEPVYESRLWNAHPDVQWLNWENGCDNTLKEYIDNPDKNYSGNKIYGKLDIAFTDKELDNAQEKIKGGYICDTRKEHATAEHKHCCSCLYGYTKVGVNDWCCRPDEGCGHDEKVCKNSQVFKPYKNLPRFLSFTQVDPKGCKGGSGRYAQDSLGDGMWARVIRNGKDNDTYYNSISSIANENNDEEEFGDHLNYIGKVDKINKKCEGGSTPYLNLEKPTLVECYYDNGKEIKELGIEFKLQGCSAGKCNWENACDFVGSIFKPGNIHEQNYFNVERCIGGAGRYATFGKNDMWIRFKLAIEKPGENEANIDGDNEETKKRKKKNIKKILFSCYD